MGKVKNAATYVGAIFCVVGVFLLWLAAWVTRGTLFVVFIANYVLWMALLSVVPTLFFFGSLVGEQELVVIAGLMFGVYLIAFAGLGKWIWRKLNTGPIPWPWSDEMLAR